MVLAYFKTTMALGKRSIKRAYSLNDSTLKALNEGSEFVNCTRTLRRKRVSVSNLSEMDALDFNSPSETTSKKRNISQVDSKNISLDSLPQDILVKILCFVDHDDLDKLLCVSMPIKEATLIAKQWHFEFSTPNSKTYGVKNFNEFEDDPRRFNMETPNAPIREQGFCRRQISREKLAEITVSLFHSPEESKNKKGLFMETEM